MKPRRDSAFLTRLARDTGGNTLALIAAAFFPLAGLIGGSVDMARIYITKAKLQQACDAGSLAGRKTMGSGSWTTAGDTSSRGNAYQLFAANFVSGSLGTENLIREFTEDEGTVTGVASVDVPMTIMRIFDQPTHNVAVTCTAEMEIPNTDVMFVLDLTASMNCSAGSSASCYSMSEQPNAKVAGLRRAVTCFYEALLKVNTATACSTAPATDPTATSYDGTAQIRLGFVPYAVNVNVGKLLPAKYVEDDPFYQTRIANTQTVYAWSTGTESITNPTSWAGTVPTRNQASGYSGWTDIGTSGGTSVSLNSNSYTKRPKGANNANLTSAQCLALNTMQTNTLLTYTDTGSVQGEVAGAATPAAPIHGTHTQQTVNYSQNDNHTIKGYRYQSYTSGDRCRLQIATDRTYTLSRTRTGTIPLTWTQYERFTNFSYGELRKDVSGLAASVAANGTTVWNSTVTIPNMGQSAKISNIRLSGQSTADADFRTTTPITATWEGCIMEAYTVPNSDGNLSDDWGSIPAAALDMDINHIPTEGNSDAARLTQWKPLLWPVDQNDNASHKLFYGRYTGTSSQRTSTKTTNPVGPTTTELNQNISEGGEYYCPVPARKLAEYYTATDFESYVGTFAATGMGTYHDIGLLWGARLLSPVGIFGSENALTANGGAIERHLIFMTDGNAATFTQNLYAYGSPDWDRRQTTYEPSTGQLTGGVNARMAALCTQVKNMNIKLWVISYGGGVDAANEARLTTCASPGHFYSAANDAALISRFKQIASEIADLRLTQ